MSLLPFTNLPPYRARNLIPAETDLGEWSQLAPLFDCLDARAGEAQTMRQFEQWILDWGELSAAVEEEGAKRHIAMTCHTDNSDAEKAYLHFVEEIEPRLKPRQFDLAKRYLEHPLCNQLPRHRYEVFHRETALRVELFREANIALETQDARLGNDYNKLSGSLTVSYRGEEKTLVAMGRYQEETDRTVREEAWRLVADCRLREQDHFDDLFDQLLKLRHQIALNAGFPNYRDYAFRSKGRFDYTPKDCEQFHQSIETEVMPAVRQLQTERARRMKIDRLRPWDLAVDSLNRPPLRPFSDVAQMETKTQTLFNRLDADLGGQFGILRHLRLLDLANRKGKAPGGYQSTLAEARMPFIFMNAVGVQRDIETILHEAGHAFHALATREEDLFAYRSAPIEFCEVASMAMELLADGFLDVFYSAPDCARARQVHLEGILGVFPWIAAVDAFQHWVYTHPDHSRADRAEEWNRILDRFGGDTDWSGCESARTHLWHKQLHIFLYPFYYVEYGIAQLGALQVWANFRKDPSQALADYKAGLALGGSRPLPELFLRAGCRFDFSRETLRPLVENVRTEISKISS